MNTQAIIAEVYSRFNIRDVDATLAFMSENVSWPKASEGGRVVGKQEIREYWARQWTEYDPQVNVLEIAELDGDKVAVKVRQRVKDLNGSVLSDGEVLHIYTFANGLIERMDIEVDEGRSDGPSAAFSGHGRTT